jgi:hypothetical protein
MSDMPETIWVFPTDGFDEAEHWLVNEHPCAFKYHRAYLIMDDPRVKALAKALKTLIDLNDNHGPFGGEIYQNLIDRTWDKARAAIDQLKEPK